MTGNPVRQVSKIRLYLNMLKNDYAIILQKIYCTGFRFSTLFE